MQTGSPNPRKVTNSFSFISQHAWQWRGWDPEESPWQRGLLGPGLVCILCIVAPLCPRVTKNCASAVEHRGATSMTCCGWHRGRVWIMEVYARNLSASTSLQSDLFFPLDGYGIRSLSNPLLMIENIKALQARKPEPQFPRQSSSWSLWKITSLSPGWDWFLCPQAFCLLKRENQGRRELLHEVTKNLDSARPDELK